MKTSPVVVVLLAAFTGAALAVTAFVALILTSSDDDPSSGGASTTPAVPADSHSTSAPAPVAPPAPAISVARSSCEDDWPVVLQPRTDGTTGLVAEARVVNDGTAAGTVTVTAEWLYFGGGSTSMAKTVTLDPGQGRRVAFTKTVPLSEGQRMVGHQHGDEMCRIRVE
jgi:hypothetical protein